MFWIICVVLVLIAFAFIFPSLKKRQFDQDDSSRQNILIAQEQLSELEHRFESGEIDQESYQSTRDELEQSVYADLNESEVATYKSKSKSSLISVVFIILLIPLITFPLYYKTGNLNFIKNIDSITDAKIARDKLVPKKADGTPDIEAMVAGLQKKMENNPDNAKGWYMLGRSYMVLKHYPDAVKSFERAFKLMPDSADVMLSLADSLSMSEQGSLIGRPGKLVNQALKIEPQNVTALWLSGMSARQEGNYQDAISQWNKVLPLIQDTPEQVVQVKGLISEARSKLPKGMKEIQSIEASTPLAAKALSEGHDVKTTAEIKVKVSISAALKDKAAPTDLVFIYAKAMSGPPMPLAAVRKQVKDLPLDVLLNDDMAMMPSLKLSAFDKVVVGARVSKSGRPIAQNGDLFAEKRSIKSGDSISIEINEVVVK